MKAPAVITGCRRSGTTLVRTILEQHPGFRVHPDEPQFLLQIWRRFGRQIGDAGTALAQFRAHPYVAPDVDWADLERCLRHGGARTFEGLVGCYLRAWMGREPGDRRPVLKDPEWVFHMRWVDRALGRPLVVHVVRDPRANVASQMSRWDRVSLFEAAWWWRQSIQRMRRWGAGHPERYHEVRYESLVSSPVEAVRDLCGFLRVSFDPAMLEFSQTEPVYTSGRPRGAIRFSHPDPVRIGLWRTSLDPEQVALIEWLTGREMRLLRYSPESSTRRRLRLRATVLWGSLCLRLLLLARRVRRATRALSWRGRTRGSGTHGTQ